MSSGATHDEADAIAVMAVSRSRDEDQQLPPTVDGRLHRVPDPTVPAVPSPTSRADHQATR